MKILYADDDPDDLEFFIEAVSEVYPSVECITAKDGLEALDRLGSIEVLPNFVFLDINMPKMGGLMCLQHMRQNPKTKAVPVVIYSTALRECDRQILQDNNARFLLKSTSFALLKDALGTLL